jgi:3-hydroxybutyryl-CoA dehydrogenase
VTARTQCIGVVGTGNIGSGLLTDLLLHGLRAVGVDVSPAALDRTRAAVLRDVRAAPLLSAALPAVSAAGAMGRLTLTTDFDALADCDFVIENVTEDWNVKRRVYERLDRIAPDTTCFGANTSCIPIARIAGATSRPDRVVGVHFMNPVPLMPTVEVIPGRDTTVETLARLDGLLESLDKRGIRVRDVPGFVSNRISHVFMNEAASALQDGVASAASIDAIFKQCFGHKMGPLETADLIGLDTVARSLDVLYESYKDEKYRCCPLLRALVGAGHLGRKTGCGFHSYAESGDGGRSR